MSFGRPFFVQTVNQVTSPGNVTATISNVASSYPYQQSALFFLASSNAATIVTPTDSTGQVWSSVWSFSSGNAQLSAWVLYGALQGTHTLTWSVGASAFSMTSLCEFCIPGAAGDAQSGSATTVAGTTNVLASPVLVNKSPFAVVFACLAVNTPTGNPSIGMTVPAGWNNINVGQLSNLNDVGQFGYTIVGQNMANQATWNFAGNTDASLSGCAALFSTSFTPQTQILGQACL